VDGWTSTYHLFAISLRQDLNRLVAASTMFANQEWEHTALGDRGVKVPDQGG
jgi:hypothetical protein